jgi:hypothetical protein
MDAAAATPIHFVGIDVSLDRCAVLGDLSGAVVREANLACDPETLIAFLHGLSLDIACVGLRPDRFRNGCTDICARPVSGPC